MSGQTPDDGEAQDAKELSRERFGRFAHEYVTSRAHAEGRDLQLFLEMANPDLDWFALDVATGGGHTALALAPQVREVVAADLTPQMLEAAQERATEMGVTNVRFVVADAEDLPFEDGSFDLVTCRIATHHFPHPDAFFSEAARVLKPVGRLVFQDQIVPEDDEAARFVNDFERTRDPSHSRALSETEVYAALQTAGFEVLRIERVSKRHDLAEWARMQGCEDETIGRLGEMAGEASGAAADWMEPRGLSSGGVSFAIRHVIIAARRLWT